VLSAAAAFAQGVLYDPYRTNPPLPHSPNVGVFDYPDAAGQDERNVKRRLKARGKAKLLE
jgi:hypothetical protein